MFDRLVGGERLDVVTKKLQFYLTVYFALWPVHPCNTSGGD